jgi:hypothetical protein
MSFQIRDFTSITASMINHLRASQREVTDFNVGAVGRTMLESVSQEIDQFYLDMFNSVKDAIPVATYATFSFDKLPPGPAAGVVTVTVDVSSQDVVIPAATVFTPVAGGMAFTNTDTMTIAAGSSTVEVSIVAVASGSAGNVAADVQFGLTPAPANFVSATNARPFNSGRDLESNDEQKQRFNSYISTLPRGTNDAVIYGAKTTALFNAAGVEVERARCVSLVEPYLDDPDQPISLILVYVHNGEGSTSGALVAEVDKVLRGYTTPAGVKVPGWKAAGVKLVTAAATEVEVDLTGAITLNPGYDGPTAIADATALLQRQILELDNGMPSLYKDRVILVGDLPAVANIVFTIGTSDVTCDRNEKLVPGTITLTAS